MVVVVVEGVWRGPLVHHPDGGGLEPPGSSPRIAPPVRNQFVRVVVRFVEREARCSSHQAHAVSQPMGRDSAIPQEPDDPLLAHYAREGGVVQTREEWQFVRTLEENDARVRSVLDVREPLDDRADESEGAHNILSFQREADRGVASGLEGDVWVESHEAGVGEDLETASAGLRRNLERQMGGAESALRVGVVDSYKALHGLAPLCVEGY